MNKYRKIRGLFGGAVVLGMMMCLTWDVFASEVSSEYDFNLEDYYVCDDFLRNGTQGTVGETVDGEVIEAVVSEVSDSGTDRGMESSDESGDIQNTTQDFRYTISSMVTSPEGIAMIERWEGCRLTAYKALSTETYYTIGYGHYGPDVTPGMTITQAEAEALLKQDLNSFETYMNNFAKNKGVIFAQNEFDAMISLVYNIGTGHFSESTIRKYIIDGFANHTDDEYTYAISMWHYSGGKSIQGLVNRRAAESALFVRYGVKRPYVQNVSLNLQGTVGLEVYLNIPGGVSAASGAYALCTYGGSTPGQEKIALSSAAHDGQVYHFSCKVVAKEMNKTISVYLYDASGIKLPIVGSNSADGYSYTSSVSEYTALANSTNNTALKNLLNAMAEYGGCASGYFGSGSYSCSSAVSGLSPAVYTPYQRTITGTATGLDYAGTTVMLKSDTKIRHYFAIKGGRQLSDYTFSITPESANAAGNGSSTVVLKAGNSDGIYYAEISNIAPVDYDKMFNVTVKNKTDGTSFNIKYSIFSYGERINAKGAATGLKNLINSMYLYNKAAEGYF